MVTRGLSGAVTSKGNQGCTFPTKCNIDPEKDCLATRTVYEVECLTCSDDPNAKKALYTGTSGFSLHKRQREHMDATRRGQTRNALAKHQASKHRGQAPRYQSKPIRGGITYNLDRYILEAYMIDLNHRNPEVNTLNQRGEWGNRGLPRLEVRASP